MADTLHWRLRATPANDSEISLEIERTLVALGHLDQVYGQYRTMLERWSGAAAQKERLRAQLEALHREDRVPLVIRLADLHERIMGRSSTTLH
jgi:hypothetical protein